MKLFLSYSREDMLLADTITRTLQEVSGIIIERSLERVFPDSQLGDQLRVQIAESDACIFILTTTSVTSSWVIAEHSWARQLSKKLIFIVQNDLSLDELPNADQSVEHLQYDPSRYSELLTSLKRIAVDLRAHYGSDGLRASEAVDARTGSGIRDLRTEEIDTLLSLSASSIADSLQPYLADAAHRAVDQFFGKPEFTRFVNIGTLETDSQALVIRAETLHALMAAAAVGTPKEYGAAGYRAGVSFGLGVVKWFLEKSKSMTGVSGLPRSEPDLIRAATKIDDASGWGRITSGSLIKGHGADLWCVDITIERDFLSAYHDRRSRADIKALARYEAFWSAYLEATFSSALSASHGLRAKLDSSHLALPLLTRVRPLSTARETLPLQFRVACVHARYRNVVEDLCREVLCPYILGDYTRVLSRARTVVEGFVRTLAGAKEATKEDIMGALQWLAQEGPESTRELGSRLQRSRNELNKGVHVGGADATEVQAYAALQAAAPPILRGALEIELTEAETTELYKVLTGKSRHA